MLWNHALRKSSEPFEVRSPADKHQIVVIGPGDDVQVLRRMRPLEDHLAHLNRNGVVAISMDNQNRHMDRAQSLGEVELGADQPVSGQSPVVEAGKRLDGRERGLQDQPGRRPPAGQGARDGAAEGTTEEHDPVRRHVLRPCQVSIGGKSILVEALFGRRAAASTITAVVEQKHGEANSVKQGEVLQSMNDVAGVSVAPQQHRRNARGADVPPEETCAVLSIEPDVLQGEAA